MKRYDDIIKALLLLVMGWFFVLQTKAQRPDPVAYMDSVEFTLITCSPHDEVYSLYGHSALGVHDLHQGREEDVAFNWGIFNYQKPFFVLRFVFGLTDYELGLSDYSAFCNYYRHWKSSVTEQTLNLTSEEKLRLNEALKENYQPQNRVYRYNFFYDNCSTRPRDIIERCVDGTVVYDERKDYSPSFREMVHEHNEHYRWMMFGNDMLLGLKADLKTSREQQEFLPANLLYDFDRARIKNQDGSWRPLVKERTVPVSPGVQVVSSGFPLSPTVCAAIMLLVSVVVVAFELRRRRTFKYWDAALMLLFGLAGCLLFVMVFSQHPTTSLNLQLLLVNPLHLFFLPAVLRRRKTRYWTLLPAMVVLFLIGAIFQHYAEGMLILALCLLLRFYSHLKNEK